MLVVIILAWVGLIFGSFAGAQVWRLRARQLDEDKRGGEPVDPQEYKRLKPLLRSASHDRSECLSCHHQLAWYDLVPLISWVSTGGRCRYCHVRIGSFEPLMELGTAALFVGSYLFWPQPLTNNLEIIRFSLWIVGCIIMAVLFAYDAKWSLLPYWLNIGLIAVSVLFMSATFIAHGFPDAAQLASIGGAVLLLGGLYYVFSLLGWVGMGDAILGVGLALFLLDWRLAFLTLFLANFLGCLMLIPLALRKQLHHGARIPFGPFLIAGAIISMLWGYGIIEKFLLMPFSVYS